MSVWELVFWWWLVITFYIIMGKWLVLLPDGAIGTKKMPCVVRLFEYRGPGIRVGGMGWVMLQHVIISYTNNLT